MTPPPTEGRTDAAWRGRGRRGSGKLVSRMAGIRDRKAVS